MRKLLLTALVASLLVFGFDRAWAEDAKEVVEKAVRAYGGADKFAQLKVVRAKAKGTVTLGKTDVPFTLETAWQWPDQLRTTAVLEAAGKNVTLTEALDGDDGWGGADGVSGPLIPNRGDLLS